MAKEFVKGVTVGEATAEENTQPAVSTVETNEEETKQVIRANEEDFIAGLIAAADFASDEEETQKIEIFRNGKLADGGYERHPEPVSHESAHETIAAVQGLLAAKDKVPFKLT